MRLWRVDCYTTSTFPHQPLGFRCWPRFSTGIPHDFLSPSDTPARLSGMPCRRSVAACRTANRQVAPWLNIVLASAVHGSWADCSHTLQSAKRQMLLWYCCAAAAALAAANLRLLASPGFHSLLSLSLHLLHAFLSALFGCSSAALEIAADAVLPRDAVIAQYMLSSCVRLSVHHKSVFVYNG